MNPWAVQARPNFTPCAPSSLACARGACCALTARGCWPAKTIAATPFQSSATTKLAPADRSLFITYIFISIPISFLPLYSICMLPLLSSLPHQEEPANDPFPSVFLITHLLSFTVVLPHLISLSHQCHKEPTTQPTHTPLSHLDRAPIHPALKPTEKPKNNVRAILSLSSLIVFAFFRIAEGVVASLSRARVSTGRLWRVPRELGNFDHTRGRNEEPHAAPDLLPHRAADPSPDANPQPDGAPCGPNRVGSTGPLTACANRVRCGRARRPVPDRDSTTPFYSGFSGAAPTSPLRLRLFCLGSSSCVSPRSGG